MKQYSFKEFANYYGKMVMNLTGVKVITLSIRIVSGLWL